MRKQQKQSEGGGGWGGGGRGGGEEGGEEGVRVRRMMLVRETTLAFSHFQSVFQRFWGRGVKPPDPPPTPTRFFLIPQTWGKFVIVWFQHTFLQKGADKVT